MTEFLGNWLDERPSCTSRAMRSARAQATALTGRRPIDPSQVKVNWQVRLLR
ncbi:hypothetical protein V8F63_02475 [Brevundimonas sp. LF-1]|uniref:hypothetical protein n=1 Tax=Brevundimonas sp. LF-1 TaxID=3126100 RepID=UPI0030E5B47A